MTTRVWIKAMSQQDQDYIGAWCNDWGAQVRSVWRDDDGVMWATIYRTQDGRRYVDPDHPGEAAMMDIEVPEKWENMFPVVLMAGAGVTVIEAEAGVTSDPPRDVRP